MKNKIPCFVLFALFSLLLSSCKDKVIVNFTYEPLEPKIGQSVQFTNLSDGGEIFDWSFQNEATGSVTRSTAENPTRTFTTPGDYVVRLRVDSNDNFVNTKRIYVYDSIPNISRDRSDVLYYGNVKFKAIAYNPYGRDETFQWFFSKNASRVDGGLLRDTTITIEDGTQADLYVAYDAEPEVFFSSLGEETVRLQMTIGTTVYTTDQIPCAVFEVKDAATRSLLMARAGGKILRQRIFENGVDLLETTDIDAGAHPFNIVSSGEELYVFDAGSHVDELADWENDANGDGSIRVVDLNSDKVQTVITNNGTSSYFGFYNGYVDAEYVYWTDRNDYVYRMPKDTRDETFEWLGADNQRTYKYYVTEASAVSGMLSGTLSGGIYAYNDTYYWAKGGTGKGLFRFKKESGKNVSDVKVILQDYAIRSFVCDRNNGLTGQIYFAAAGPEGKAGLWVSDMDGNNVRMIDEVDLSDGTITGIVLDYTAGKVMWAYNNSHSPEQSGVKQVKLLLSVTEMPGEPTYFNREQDILGIALDNVPKVGI